MKKAKLVREDHIKIGNQLKLVHKNLLEIYLTLCNTEGSRSFEAKSAKRILDDIDTLRCRLDSVLCESLPADDDSWKGVYYGSPQG